MKFWDISLFLFIVNVFAWFFVGFSTSLGYTEYNVFHEPKQTELETMETKVYQGISDEEITGDDPVTYALGIMYSIIKKSILAVMNPLKEYILWFPYLLMNYEVPEAFALGMGAIYYLIMLVGLVQIITGRSFKQVE